MVNDLREQKAPYADAATSSTLRFFAWIFSALTTPVEKSIVDYIQIANFYSRKITCSACCICT
jgi:hypothetical protein